MHAWCYSFRTMSIIIRLFSKSYMYINLMLKRAGTMRPTHACCDADNKTIFATNEYHSEGTIIGPRSTLWCQQLAIWKHLMCILNVSYTIEYTAPHTTSPIARSPFLAWGTTKQSNATENHFDIQCISCKQRLLRVSVEVQR